jgi:hypothetical protein
MACMSFSAPVAIAFLPDAKRVLYVLCPALPANHTVDCKADYDYACISVFGETSSKSTTMGGEPAAALKPAKSLKKAVIGGDALVVRIIVELEIAKRIIGSTVDNNLAILF